jgi:hypothetical protein
MMFPLRAIAAACMIFLAGSFILVNIASVLRIYAVHIG